MKPELTTLFFGAEQAISKNTSGYGTERRPETPAQNGNRPEPRINRGFSFPAELQTWSGENRESKAKQRKNGGWIWRVGGVDRCFGKM